MIFARARAPAAGPGRRRSSRSRIRSTRSACRSSYAGIAFLARRAGTTTPLALLFPPSRSRRSSLLVGWLRRRGVCRARCARRRRGALASSSRSIARSRPAWRTCRCPSSPAPRDALSRRRRRDGPGRAARGSRSPRRSRPRRRTRGSSCAAAALVALLSRRGAPRRARAPATALARRSCRRSPVRWPTGSGRQPAAARLRLRPPRPARWSELASRMAETSGRRRAEVLLPRGRSARGPGLALRAGRRRRGRPPARARRARRFAAYVFASGLRPSGARLARPHVLVRPPSAHLSALAPLVAAGSRLSPRSSGAASARAGESSGSAAGPRASDRVAHERDLASPAS